VYTIYLWGAQTGPATIYSALIWKGIPGALTCVNLWHTITPAQAGYWENARCAHGMQPVNNRCGEPDCSQVSRSDSLGCEIPATPGVRPVWPGVLGAFGDI